jgi:endo-1,4-beta-xylanase
VKRHSLLALLVALLLVVMTQVGTWATKPDKFLWQVANFPVGVACDPTLLQDRSGYRRVVSEEFNSITPETEQKWAAIRPSQDKFNFTKADILVNWAVANKKRVHGHTLLWHSPDGNPKWLQEFQGSRADWENLMKTHIQTVVRHYKGKIKSWDVVNEAFTETGELRMANPNQTPGKDDGSIWARNLGPDYLARAYQYAHAADPKALLFYNDFNQNLSPKKLAAIERMVKDFKKRKIPLDGLGLQFHLDISNSNEGLSKAMKASAKTGLLVHISELDVLTSNWKNDPNLTYDADLQKRHGAKYKFIAQEYQRVVPKKQRYGITHWNVGDSDSWITQWLKLKDWPLLFDENYQRKKIYYDYREGLKPLAFKG